MLKINKSVNINGSISVDNLEVMSIYASLVEGEKPSISQSVNNFEAYMNNFDEVSRDIKAFNDEVKKTKDGMELAK